jgi:hypothetical protein
MKPVRQSIVTGHSLERMIFAGSLVILVFVAARSLVFKRLNDIRAAMSRMTFSKQVENLRGPGDEL